MIKSAMKAGGLAIREAPDEEFYVVRVNYEKMHKAQPNKVGVR